MAQLVSICFALFIMLIATTASNVEMVSSPMNDVRRIQLESELSNGISLLREILEKSPNGQLQDLERLSAPLRTKRCRWKLCGTGRRFRYL
ncbi:unnamed protein product [Caenorhabditis bovis]|uniref:Uncharacterized protein n=1 Tax=Caenorhabditis bovis TaxID=2654633 RepID=A0A8S1ELP4_9PELO|nr:unnamed protein product [Caenorhabditis bovis]